MTPEQHAEQIRAKAPKFGESKAQRVYLEDFRKVKLALLMKDALASGITAANAQEREALSNQEYVALLKGIGAAIEIEKTLKWELESHRLDIEIWRTRQASERLQIKSHE